MRDHAQMILKESAGTHCPESELRRGDTTVLNNDVCDGIFKWSFYFLSYA